jgi:ABC-type transport system involved in multi-copper enzyme maturation permease subunit
MAFCRTKRWFVLRSLMVAVLALGLFGFLAARADFLRETASFDEIGRILFGIFAFVQVVFVFFASPGLAADLIVGERRRGTLDILLTTPLRPVSILLGKLMSRLALLALMVVASFPVVSISLLYGGVRGEQVLGLLAVTLGTILWTAGPALLISTFARRLGTAATLAYVLPLFVAFALPAVAGLLGAADGPDGRPLFLAAVHPLFAVFAVAVEDVQAFPNPLLPALLHLGVGAAVAALCVAVATLRLARERTGMGLPGRILAAFARARGRSPDAVGRRPRRPLSGMGNPVLWKEVNLVNASHSRVLLVIILALFGFLELLLVVSGATDQRAAHLTILGAETLLLLVVAAANSGACVASERESGSLDLLRVTLLTPAQIAHGKVAGILRSLAPLAAVPLGHVLIYGLLGELPMAAFPALLISLPAVMFFFSIQGIASSCVHPRAAKAVRRSITLLALLVIGVPILLLLLVAASHSGERALEFLSFSNPIAVVVYPVEYLAESRELEEWSQFFVYTVIWTGFYFAVSVVRLLRLPAVLERALRRDGQPGAAE